LRAAQAITASTGWRLREDLPLAVRQQRQAHNADHQALRDAGLFPRWRMGDLWYKTSTGAVTQLDYVRDNVQDVIKANTAEGPQDPQGPPTEPVTAHAPPRAPTTAEKAKHPRETTTVPPAAARDPCGPAQGPATSGAGPSVQQQDTTMAEA
jgi:hypothetical protein